jgi:Spy/CpxP family protein refolding chaperone
MKRIVLLILALAGLSLAACAPRAPDPDRFAAKFFEHGKDSILDAMKDQKVSESQLAAARGILRRNEPGVQREMASAMRAQQELMLALSSGRDSATLLKFEADQNQVQDQALRTIGRMHEELASAVGPEKWKGTSAQLEERYSRYFKPRK